MGKRWPFALSAAASWERESMRKYVIILAVLCMAQVAVGRTPQENRPRPTPTPPPRTEVYATARDGTKLEWTVYTPIGKGPWPAVLVTARSIMKR